MPVLKAFGWDDGTATKIHELRVARLRRAYRAGVRIVFGTDVMVAVDGETRGTLAVAYVTSFMDISVLRRVAFVMKDGNIVREPST